MARTAVRAQRGAAGRAHRSSRQARDTPIPQGLPCGPQCTRPRCGERLEYLATEQVHLYRAGTNGRPVQQSYTLTGSATRADDKDPPPTDHSREGPGKAPGEHRPKRRRKETEGGGHAKGAAGGHTTNRPQPGGAGNHTAETGEGPRHTAPNTHTEPPNQAQKGEDRHPNAPPTHCTHARACTQHTLPQPPPTRAPQTHTTHQSASTARTTNATHANPKNKNPATPRQGSCRAARNTARTQRWTHQALSQE